LERDCKLAVERAVLNLFDTAATIPGKPAKLIGKSLFCFTGYVIGGLFYVQDSVGVSMSYRELTGESPAYHPIPLEKIEKNCIERDQELIYLENPESKSTSGDNHVDEF
jgi:hypothetical protein